MNRTGSCGWYKNGAMSGNVRFKWSGAALAAPLRFLSGCAHRKAFSKILPERLDFPDKRGIIPVCNECNKHVGE